MINYLNLKGKVAILCLQERVEGKQSQEHCRYIQRILPWCRNGVGVILKEECGAEESVRQLRRWRGVLEKVGGSGREFPQGVDSGDFYGHVGERNRCEEVCLKESNSKGQMLVDFAKSMEMVVVNMYFKKRAHRRCFWVKRVFREDGRNTLRSWM